MVHPEAVVRVAKRRKAQNLRFRVWLKGHAKEDELDERFKALHEELFADYDCCDCGNCCKMYPTTLKADEIERIADYLKMSVSDFRSEYLVHDEYGDGFPAPCPMLQEDGRCRVQPVKPEECRGFPYTDRPGRMESLYGVMEFAGRCPVVYEIVERLKQLYGFR